MASFPTLMNLGPAFLPAKDEGGRKNTFPSSLHYPLDKRQGQLSCLLSTLLPATGGESRMKERKSLPHYATPQQTRDRASCLTSLCHLTQNPQIQGQLYYFARQCVLPALLSVAAIEGQGQFYFSNDLGASSPF